MVEVIGKSSGTDDKNKTDIGFIHYFTNGLQFLVRESFSFYCLYGVFKSIEAPTKSIDLVGEVHVEDQYYYYMLVRNITKEHEQEELIFHLAYHDVLTDLYNRTYFTEHMDAVYEQKQGGALILSDLNFFKIINDTYGHQIGDDVLVHTATILRDMVKSPNIVARLGGDEFIMHIPDNDEQNVRAFIDSMRYQFSVRPFVKDQLVIEVIPSFGFTMIGEDDTYEITYQLADAAMYEDKRILKEARAKKERQQNEALVGTMS